jgi:hypothetical protein
VFRGWIGRKVDIISHQPKWFTMGELNNLYHVLGDYTTNKTFVVVEDIISCLRVSKFFPCLCLFGLNFNSVLQQELAYDAARVVFWLDDGATQQALSAAQQMESFSIPSSILWTTGDPKDYSDEEIQEKINSVIDRHPLTPKTEVIEAQHGEDWE